MKKYLISLTLLFISFNSLIAQELSKTEKKALILEIKEMKKSPEKLLTLKQNQEFSDKVVDQQIEIISGLKKEAQVNALKLNETEQMLQTSDANLAKSMAILNNLNNSGSSTAPMKHQGEKYRVQIGLYRNIDFSNLLKDPKFLVHEFVNGTNRYSIGNFNSEEEAELFKVEMRKMGIKGAFVSTYTDGLRTDNLAPGQTITPSISSPVNVVPKNGAVVNASTTTTNGFNVKPSTYNKNSESNPNQVESGTVISSKPINEAAQEATKNGEQIQFKEESNKTNGIKINIRE